MFPKSQICVILKLYINKRDRERNYVIITTFCSLDVCVVFEWAMAEALTGVHPFVPRPV